MTNLEKFYPGEEAGVVQGRKQCFTHDPDDGRYCIDCKSCRACDFCDTDLEHKTCIDTFEAWAKMEAV